MINRSSIGMIGCYQDVDVDGGHSYRNVLYFAPTLEVKYLRRILCRVA